jgi:hypothetical protein
VIYLDPYRETFEGAVHGSEIYFIGEGSKGVVLSRFPVMKKKKESVRLWKRHAHDEM